MVSKCDAITKSGTQCQGNALPGRPYCYAHDPDKAKERAEANRAGGEARSNARRAIKAWTEFGREVDTADLPLILYSCMEAVRTGAMTPGQATAIANLAKAAISIMQDAELTERITALEEAISNAPQRIVRVKAGPQ